MEDAATRCAGSAPSAMRRWRGVPAVGAVVALLTACSVGGEPLAQEDPRSPTSAAVSPPSPPSAPGSAVASPRAPETGGLTRNEAAVIDALLRFARSGERSAAAAIPFADEGVLLGLSNQLLVMKSGDELRDAAAWTLEADAFRGYVGPFSPIQILSEAEEVTEAAGAQPHCASPPIQPHPDTADLRQLSIQPAQPQGCLQWWTVDVFLDGGEVVAVTIDL